MDVHVDRYVMVWVRVGIHVSGVGESGGQRTSYRSRYSPSTMWVWDQIQVIKLGRKHLHLLSHLTGSVCIFWGRVLYHKVDSEIGL